MGYRVRRNRKKGVRFTAMYHDADGEEDATNARREAERRVEYGKGDLLILGRTELKKHIAEERFSLQIVTPEQFDRFHSALGEDIPKLLAEVAIGTGMR